MVGMNESMMSVKPELEMEVRRSPRIAAAQAQARLAGGYGSSTSKPSTSTCSAAMNQHVFRGKHLTVRPRPTSFTMMKDDETDCCNNNISTEIRKDAPNKNRENPQTREEGKFAIPRSSRTLLRRKRNVEEAELDNINVNSLNLSKRCRGSSLNDDIDDHGDNISIQSYTVGTSTIRSRTLVRVASLASLVSPVSSVKKVGIALQRSMSFRTSHSPPFNIKPYCKPAATPTKRRDSRLWSETVPSNINKGLTKKQIKRQEIIYELFHGELDMVDDLRLIMKTYRDSMRSLGMLSEQELETIFGRLEDLQPMHQDLINKMIKQRRADGTTDTVGKVLLEWLPTLTNAYTAYCTNLLAAKVLLDEKRQDKKVHDFLERCQESPFSRRLDLWNFLDVPRRRLLKYPLLIQKILEATPSDHPDKTYLANATKAAEGVSQEVDRQTGEMKCRHYIDHLIYLKESQESPLISQQKTLLCGGVLRNIKGRGMKMHVFLFEDILVVTRIATKNDKKMYRVYENPIPVQYMKLEDIVDGEAKLGGSFRSLTGGQTVKHAFRVKSTNPNLRQSFTFFAADEHDKKQWVQLFRTAIRIASSDVTEV